MIRNKLVPCESRFPNLSLVVLIGPSGSGKSTFARKHFLPSEVLSSDYCRGLVSDDENDQAATDDAFEVLHLHCRQAAGTGAADRRRCHERAARGSRAAGGIWPASITACRSPSCSTCRRTSATSATAVETTATFGPHVIRQQKSQLRRSLKALKREGFRHVFVMESVEEVEAATIERVPLWNDRTDEHGPFDIIGDVHGCCDELEELLGATRLRSQAAPMADPLWGGAGLLASRWPQGDLRRRSGGSRPTGSRSPCESCETWSSTASALCVPGNHDMKLLKKLRGKDVQITHGLAQSLAEIEALPDETSSSRSASRWPSFSMAS